MLSNNKSARSIEKVSLLCDYSKNSDLEKSCQPIEKFEK